MSVYKINSTIIITSIGKQNINFRQGMAPVLEMAMVAKLLMILIDSPMMWDVPKKIS